MSGRTQRQTYLFEQLTFFVKDSNCIWTVCCLCCISQFYECDVTCFSLEGTELRCFTYDKYGTERRTEAGLRSLARVKPSEKHLHKIVIIFFSFLNTMEDEGLPELIQVTAPLWLWFIQIFTRKSCSDDSYWLSSAVIRTATFEE